MPPCDEPDTPNPDNPPLVKDQKGAGEAGTLGGSPESTQFILPCRWD
jgi:hypothetical protein